MYQVRERETWRSADGAQRSIEVETFEQGGAGAIDAVTVTIDRPDRSGALRVTVAWDAGRGLGLADATAHAEAMTAAVALGERLAAGAEPRGVVAGRDVRPTAVPATPPDGAQPDGHVIVHVATCPVCHGQRYLNTRVPAEDDDVLDERVWTEADLAECRDRGWWAVLTSEGWRPVPAGTPQATEDLNRLLSFRFTGRDELYHDAPAGAGDNVEGYRG